jgi:hypothetical protein
VRDAALLRAKARRLVARARRLRQAAKLVCAEGRQSVLNARNLSAE